MMLPKRGSYGAIAQRLQGLRRATPPAISQQSGPPAIQIQGLKPLGGFLNNSQPHAPMTTTSAPASWLYPGAQQPQAAPSGGFNQGITGGPRVNGPIGMPSYSAAPAMTSVPAPQAPTTPVGGSQELGGQPLGLGGDMPSTPPLASSSPRLPLSGPTGGLRGALMK